mgnify:CR=1 FL=1
MKQKGLLLFLGFSDWLYLLFFFSFFFVFYIQNKTKQNKIVSLLFFQEILSNNNNNYYDNDNQSSSHNLFSRAQGNSYCTGFLYTTTGCDGTLRYFFFSNTREIANNNKFTYKYSKKKKNNKTKLNKTK